jgi:hypothetical protein
MSLEAKIAELTLAVQALTIALRGAVAAAPVAAAGEDVKAATAEDTKPAKEEPAVKNESSTQKSGEQSASTQEQSSPALTYDDVKKATNNLSAAKGKEVTIAALSRFGVKRATELTEAQWAEYCSYTADCVTGKIDPREAA